MFVVNGVGLLANGGGVDEDISILEEWVQSMAADCDQAMTDVTEEDIASAVGSGEGGNDSGGGGAGLAALDREILAILNASGGNHSTKNDTWSRRRFDEWRLQNGMPTSVPIETMDLNELANQLPTFFRQVKKHSGDHYPLESLLGFYRGFTRIMQKAQEARTCETLVMEIPFCMRTHPIFQQTGIAFLEAMRRSVLAGANKRRRKVPATVKSWENEQAMLADKDHQASHPYGCFRRWAYYSISRFVIRSGKELYNVMDCDFQEQKDEKGDCIVYGERLLKNAEAEALTAPASPPVKAGRMAAKRPKIEPPKVPVKCHQEDVIHTYRQFMKHQPVKVGEEIGKPRHLFLQPIGNPVTNAWFAKSHISERVLISIFKTMSVIAGVNVKDGSNKAGRPTIGMRGKVASGASSNGLYDRYVTKVDQQTVAAQRSTDIVSASAGGKRNLQEAFGEMVKENDDAQQNSLETPSVKSVQLLSNGVDHVSTAAVSGLAGQDVLTKLQIARNQFKDLELTLFGNVTLPGVGTSTTGQSLRDLVQVAMSQLKGLEATLSSMTAIS